MTIVHTTCMRVSRIRDNRPLSVNNVHAHVHCIQQCITFIHNHVSVMVLCQNLLDSNAMLLPGRVPDYKDSGVKLLPSSTTKHALWELYLQAAASSSMRAVAYPTFTQLWRQLLPNVVLMKPMSDLCWVCQQNSTAIMRAANRPEEKPTVSIHANVCSVVMYAQVGIN